MDDGYDFGEAVKEAMRQGYAKGGPVSEALLKKINNTQIFFFYFDRHDLYIQIAFLKSFLLNKI